MKIIERFVKPLGLICTVLLTAILGSFHAAQAQTTTEVYANQTSTFEGSIQDFGSSGTASNMLATLITPAAGYSGDLVEEFDWTIGNANSTAQTESTTIDFYSNSVSNTPGTLIDSYLFNAVSIPAGQIEGYDYVVPAGSSFALPSSAFWVGVSETGPAATKITKMGPGIFSAPTIGTSGTTYFAGSTTNVSANNPAGTVNTIAVSGSGFGFDVFVTVPAVAPSPEVPAVDSMLITIVALFGLGLYARRRNSIAI